MNGKNVLCPLNFLHKSDLFNLTDLFITLKYRNTIYLAHMCNSLIVETNALHIKPHLNWFFPEL